jgi:ABC-type lipoprotein export system ATPase subunit
MPLNLTGVGFSYQDGEPVVTDLSLTIEDGSIVAITGPSGSGKTTLLQLIGGLLKPTTGTIAGRPPPGEIRWVFQTPTALTRRKVLDNVLLGIHQHRLDERTARAHALRAVSEVGLGTMEDRLAGSLSGGELQRTQIARTLVGSPPLVLADEPTGQLDRNNTLRVADALVQSRRPDSTVVVATHDPVVSERCDRQLELRDGRLIAGAD